MSSRPLADIRTQEVIKLVWTREVLKLAWTRDVLKLDDGAVRLVGSGTIVDVGEYDGYTIHGQGSTLGRPLNGCRHGGVRRVHHPCALVRSSTTDMLLDNR